MRERREGSVRRDRERKGKKSWEGGAVGGRCKENSCRIVLPCVDYVFTPHSCGCVLSADELYKVDKTVVGDILVQEHMEGEGSPPAPLSGDRKDEAEQEEVKMEEVELENDEHNLKERKVLDQEGEEQEGEEQDAEEEDTSAVESLLQESRSNILVVVKETSHKKGNTCMHIPNSAYIPI